MAENTVLPAGVYPVRILSCDLHSFSKGGQGYRIKFKPKAPEHKGAVHTEWLAFDYEPGLYLDKGRRLIQEIWFAAGNPGLWEDFPFAAATIEGQECAIKLSVRDDNRTPGAKQNRLEGAWTLDGKKYVKPKATAEPDVPF